MSDKKEKLEEKENFSPLRQKIHEIIFEADTPAGKAFDVVVLWMIVISVVAVALESVKEINRDYKQVFLVVEWVLTVAFSIEYILRIYSVKNPWGYIFSFYGTLKKQVHINQYW